MLSLNPLPIDIKMDSLLSCFPYEIKQRRYEAMSYWSYGDIWKVNIGILGGSRQKLHGANEAEKLIVPWVSIRCYPCWRERVKALGSKLLSFLLSNYIHIFCKIYFSLHKMLSKYTTVLIILLLLNVIFGNRKYIELRVFYQQTIFYSTMRIANIIQ